MLRHFPPVTQDADRDTFSAIPDDAAYRLSAYTPPRNTAQSAPAETLHHTPHRTPQERLRLARLVVRGSLSEGEYDLLLGEIESKAAGLVDRLELARQRLIDLDDVARRTIRLQEVIDAGPDVLGVEDERAVNAWLRKHMRAYVARNHVVAVEWI